MNESVSCLLIHSPVLNFLQSNLTKEIEDDVNLCHGFSLGKANKRQKFLTLGSSGRGPLSVLESQFIRNYRFTRNYSSSKPVENQATIVISKTLIDLDNLIKRRDAITKIHRLEAIHSVKASGHKLFVRIDTTAAKKFCGATSSVLTNCDTRLEEYKFFGIGKGVDKTCAAELFIGWDGVVDAKKD
ncbi:hypothetical protein QYM36_016237 [Artemia franciscana]|uniref:Uncharacterized protein n=1 Tax=Artemia franciscana TaxID=6661 RepID=A0AA88KXU6_ARTSF|nr:hypothetical protein QYM36_016237 [Artemia franciscana]